MTRVLDPLLRTFKGLKRVTSNEGDLAEVDAVTEGVRCWAPSLLVLAPILGYVEQSRKVSAAQPALTKLLVDCGNNFGDHDEQIPAELWLAMLQSLDLKSSVSCSNR